MVIMDITPIIIKLKKIKIKNLPTHIDLLKCVLEMKKKNGKNMANSYRFQSARPFRKPMMRVAAQ